MARTWTPQQKAAIESRSGTLLLSAAAGSGKTAVLVERVLGWMLDPERPVDVDKLLVMTFSNPAAKEMKQRISQRLGDLLRQDPQNTTLLRQQLLLPRAHISTIHAFCLQLLKDQFQRLDLAPDFRLADEKQMVVLRKQAAQEVLEEAYAQVELVSSSRSDRRLQNLLLELYDFVRSHPFYEDWLDDKLALYTQVSSVEESPWGRVILDYARDALRYGLDLTFQCLDRIQGDEALEKAYLSAYQQDAAQLQGLLEPVEHGQWDAVCQALSSFSFARLGALKNYEDLGTKTRLSACREEVKKIVARLKEKLFCATSQEFLEDLQDLLPKIQALFQLTKQFAHRLDALKGEQKLVDFGDLEQLTLQLLFHRDHGVYTPTELAKTLSENFQEILVDEYQDTNQAQDMIFTALSKGEKNLFMVGDVKQSIYRFRQAMPEIFLAKKRDYPPWDGKTCPSRLALGHNFRSRSQVTGLVNFFFTLLMSEPLGEIDYNAQEELVPAATYQPYEPAMGELHLLVEDKELDKTQQEADFVAKTVRELLDRPYLVQDGETMRPIQPRDIGILLRSPRGKSEQYAQALAKVGVTAWAQGQGGFLSSREVAAVVCVLKALDNPLDDISLAGAMLSPLFGFTADDLARLRMVKHRAPLYVCLVQLAPKEPAMAAFLEQMGELRRFAASHPADDLLRELYRRTGILAMAARETGGLRQANLRLLCQYAAQYHQSGYQGLSGFVGFLRRLQEQGDDLEPALTISESANVVRIMSIHKSKGLEMPVVFLCDLAKSFNRQDLRRNDQLHWDLGFACARRDPRTLQQFPTVPLAATRLDLERAMLSEELRILYVALTRAKEKLILTGVVGNLEQKVASQLSPLEKGKLSPYVVRGGECYLDWILAGVLHHPDSGPLCRQAGVDAGEMAPAQAPLAIFVHECEEQEMQENQERIFQAQPQQELLGEIRRRLAWQYPYEDATKIPTKFGVSQLVHPRQSTNALASRPSFTRRRHLTGAERGTAHHLFFQFADHQRAAQDPQEELERLVREGYLTPEQGQAVVLDKVRAYFASDLAQRIARSPRVLREVRFVAQLGRQEVGAFLPDLGENRVNVQGVADCVFQEGEELILVDYKTDRIAQPQELADRYRNQLMLYKLILSRNFGRKVGQCILYSLHLNQEVPL